MNLYDIDERLRMLEESFVDIETGVIVQTEEEFNSLLDEIQMDILTKIENTMCFYKNLISDAEQLKEEEKKLAQRRKVKENLAERLKNRIDYYITNKFKDENGNVDMDSMKKWKMETPRVKISYRKSDMVDISDIDKIPKEYIKIKTEVSANKTELKKILKSGKSIDGCELKTNLNMQVK